MIFIYNFLIILITAVAIFGIIMIGRDFNKSSKYICSQCGQKQDMGWMSLCCSPTPICASCYILNKMRHLNDKAA